MEQHSNDVTQSQVCWLTRSVQAITLVQLAHKPTITLAPAAAGIVPSRALIKGSQQVIEALHLGRTGGRAKGVGPISPGGAQQMVKAQTHGRSPSSGF